MPERKPHSAARIVSSFAKDVLTAGGAAALGGAVGGPIYLGVGSLLFDALPTVNDFLLVPWAIGFGLVEGTIGGVILRIGVGRIQRRRLWAFGFLLFGGVAGVWTLVALVSYALSKIPCIIIAAG